MENVNKILMSVIIALLTQTIVAQQAGKPAEPEAPVGVEFEVPEFNFDFQDFRMLNAEDEKELLKNLREELKNELKVIKEVDKEKYFELLRESQFKNMRIPFMAKREKVMHEREMKIFESEIKAEALAVRYGKANQAQRNRIKDELRTALNNLFEEKEMRREDEVRELENELKELRKSLAVRQMNKNNIIERRIQDLLDEDEYLDWD